MFSKSDCGYRANQGMARINMECGVGIELCYAYQELAGHDNKASVICVATKSFQGIAIRLPTNTWQGMQSQL